MGLAMKVSDFTMCERKVREAAATGTLVDLRVGDSDIHSPEKGTKWGPERTVRAEVIVDLLIGGGDTASMAVRGVGVQGARITGDLNLAATPLRCPLALLDCSFACAINLKEATAMSLRLRGSHIPAVHARQLRTRGDLQLDEGFSVSHGIDLAGAHIGGQLSNPDGPALSADRLSVDGGMFCREGFEATGEVRLLRAHIGGQLVCTGGQFSNPDGPAITADGLTVDGSMFCDKGFEASLPAVLLHPRPPASGRQSPRTRCLDRARCRAGVECGLHHHGLDPRHRRRPESHWPSEARLT